MSIVCIYSFYVHASINRHLGYFHLLAIVNSAAVNMSGHVFEYFFSCFGFIPRNRVAGPYSNFIFKFFLRNCKTVFAPQ